MQDEVRTITATKPSTPGAALRKREPFAGAYFWLLAFFLVYCARPEDYIPGVAHLRPALITGVFVLLAFVLSAGQLKMGLPKEVLYLAALLIQFFIASALSPVWKGGSTNVTLIFAKAVLIVVVMVLTVNSLARLRKLIFVQAGSVALIACISVRTSHRVGARLTGVLNGIYGNPNDLALAIVLSLPFCLVFFLRARNPFKKAAWAAACAVMAYAVFPTGSRAGFLALVIAGAICLWYFGVKGRRFTMVFAALILGVGLFAFAGHQVMTRLSDTSGGNGNYEAAHGSEQARRQMLIRSLEVTAQHPLFGVGLGNFQIISGSWHDTHNVYTALSSEAGIPALILFLMVYWIAFGNLSRAVRRVGNDSELGMWANALRASLVAFALAAFFFPDAYQFFVYFLFAFTSVVYKLAEQEEPVLHEPVRGYGFRAAGGIPAVNPGLVRPQRHPEAVSNGRVRTLPFT